MPIIEWKRNPALLIGQEYLGNQLLARNIAEKGYEAILQEYVYIKPAFVAESFKYIPMAWESMHGVGIDLGGGVGCISSTVALKPEINSIYCVELSEDVVRKCQPIVIQTILGDSCNKVTSVIGDFDQLEIADNSMDFALTWHSMHHSVNPVDTLRECFRVLKKKSRFIMVERAHNNSTPQSEIDRMLGITYSKEFLRNNYRPENQVLTRRENGEHEYRFEEWVQYLTSAGFKIISGVVIKTNTAENKSIINDHGLKEILVDHAIGCFGNRKVGFLLEKP
jgi:ubiquinone/menaquinone biosynthesis C-methylase UbiE